MVDKQIKQEIFSEQNHKLIEIEISYERKNIDDMKLQIINSNLKSLNENGSFKNTESRFR